MHLARLLPVALAAAALQLQEPARVTLRQFRELAWLTGRWKGTGAGNAGFYEQYIRKDDSTIVMYAFTDSTFANKNTDSSVIEFRDGRVRTRTARNTYDVISFAPTSVRFRRTGTTSGGHQFTRVSANEWTATLFPGGGGSDTTVFRMRRVQSGSRP